MIRSRDPLFIRFANGKVSGFGIMESFRDSTESKESKDIIDRYLEGDEPDVSQFRDDFSNCLDDIIERGGDQYVRNYLTNYMQPALLEYRKEGAFRTSTNLVQWVGIKDEKSTWLEAVVCYNLCMFIKGLDIGTLKRCPICKDFFVHKGKYAKFCSEECKTRTGQ